MNFRLFKPSLIIITLCVIPALAKRPRKEKPPKEPRPALTQEQKQIIAANVAQMMGGICAIAQEPRNAHNVGSSVATMIQALINIIVEKFARKNIDLNNPQNREEFLALLREDMSKEITEIIITKKMFRI
ncbi:MAG TPA: hypothetical protein VKU36_00185 [Candidatus Babeliales bacterium]|nr:hypothetical protein [Candidatus Babeliales bacterium]